jgi:hypothetical protein
VGEHCVGETLGTSTAAQTSTPQVRGKIPRGSEAELFKMLYRHWIGDVMLAILIAVPAAALAQPDSTTFRQAAHSPAAQKSAVVLASAAERQVGLFR